MAADIFAKIGTIKGESQDAKHKDEIEVLSWSWGVTQSGSIGAGGGGGQGKASFHDFNFTHHVDKASPVLMKACATGEHIKEATITVRKAGKGQQEYLIIKLTDVIVTSVALSVAGDDAATAESIAIQFAKVDLEYKPQKPDGSLDVGDPLQVRHQGEQGGLAPEGAGRRGSGACAPRGGSGAEQQVPGDDDHAETGQQGRLPDPVDVAAARR